MNLLCIKCSNFIENIGIKIKREIGEEIFININLVVLSKNFVTITKEEILIFDTMYEITSWYCLQCRKETKLPF